MTLQQRFRGDDVQQSQPNWEPALALLGPDLVPWFMWMGELRLDDGTSVQVYKQHHTRRSIHISADGRRTFYYDWDGSDVDGEEPDYVEHAPSRAIRACFSGVPLPLRGRDLRELLYLVDEACARALSGRPFQIDPAELEAQRKFDEAA